MRYLAIFLTALLILEGICSQDTTVASGADATTAADAGGGTTQAAGDTTAGAEETTAGGAATTAAAGETTAAGASTTGAGTETTAAGERAREQAQKLREQEGQVKPRRLEVQQVTALVKLQLVEENKLRLLYLQRISTCSGTSCKEKRCLHAYGANMQFLRYDCELEIKARARAEECAAEGIDGVNADYEENRHYVSKSEVASAESPKVDAMAACERVVETSEAREPIGLACYFRANHQSRSVRSFTRMPWANSNKIACTVQECGDRWHSVCLYSLAGNIVEERIYISGNTCSVCPPGTSCNALGVCEKKPKNHNPFVGI